VGSKVSGRGRLACVFLMAGSALTGCMSVSAPERPAASSDDIMRALSLAVSMNLAKTCPRQFEMTRDAQKLDEAEMLRAKIGPDRFGKALEQLKAPPDCQVAKTEAMQMSDNFPYSVIK
jgi:hypothetical protein